MSKVINNTILKKINGNPDEYSKKQLIEYLNQMKGLADHLQISIKRHEEMADFWQNHAEKAATYIGNFYNSNIFKRIYVAIRKEIR